eukprot:TRINITY_DN20242_c0_g1_i1.p1 TRINITY_DN20242_c0_g1~~TRINITY_DN20242_c0_g1_i1.p1  ORF type:complete len:466 (-),score=123.68 TRINITY_DN20242_c0_g1_i1:67-1398(-)
MGIPGKQRASSMTGWVRSAKEKAVRVAGERSALMQSMMDTAKSEKGSGLFERVKAKAESVMEAAAAAASAAVATEMSTPSAKSAPAGRRRPSSRHAVRSAARRLSRCGGESTSADKVSEADAATQDERDVTSLTSVGWSPVAARLALCRSGGGVRNATAWLAEEANSEEILAAEAAEIWAAEMADRKEASSPWPGGGCPEDFLASEECLLLGDAAETEEDGRGLGMGRATQESLPPMELFPSSEDHEEPSAASSAEPPMLSDSAVAPTIPVTPAARSSKVVSGSPGLYGRLYQKQDADTPVGKNADAVAIFEDSPVHPSETRSLAAHSPAFFSDRRVSETPTQASAQGELPACSGDEDEEGEDNSDEDEDVAAQAMEEEETLPEPPDGGSWEWPLSRQEKKARVQMADRHMAELDKKALIQALIKERMVSRAGRLSSCRASLG